VWKPWTAPARITGPFLLVILCPYRICYLNGLRRRDRRRIRLDIFSISLHTRDIRAKNPRKWPALEAPISAPPTPEPQKIFCLAGLFTEGRAWNPPTLFPTPFPPTGYPSPSVYELDYAVDPVWTRLYFYYYISKRGRLAGEICAARRIALPPAPYMGERRSPADPMQRVCRGVLPQNPCSTEDFQRSTVRNTVFRSDYGFYVFAAYPLDGPFWKSAYRIRSRIPTPSPYGSPNPRTSSARNPPDQNRPRKSFGINARNSAYGRAEIRFATYKTRSRARAGRLSKCDVQGHCIGNAAFEGRTRVVPCPS